jgi:cell division protein FtsA
VHREVQGAGYGSRLAGGIVLTGGGAAMEGITELASSVFGTGVRVGVPGEHVGGLSDSVEAPRFATAVGLALYGANRLVTSGGAPSAKRNFNSPGVDKIAKRMKNWLEDFF